MEDLVAKVARGLLDGLRLAVGASLRDAVGNTGAMDVQRDREPLAELLNEGEVGVGVGTTQAVVDVYHRQPHAECVTRQCIFCGEQKQQSDRIRAPRDSGVDAVSRANERAIKRRRKGCHQDYMVTRSGPAR